MLGRSGFRIAVAAIVALLWAFSAGGAEPPGEAAEIYTRALAAFKLGHHDEALKELDAAFQASPRPVYVYNMGRVLEAMGRLRDAHQAYLRVGAIPGADAEIKALARSAADALAPFALRVVVRLAEVPPGSVAQIDGVLVANVAVDMDFPAGTRLLCVTTQRGRRLACRRRSLPVGVRTTWPLPDPPDSRAVVAWTGLPGATVLKLDGIRLIVDLGKLTEIELDVGHHDLELATADGSIRTGAIDLVAGPVRSVAEAFPKPKVAPVDAPVVVELATAPGASPWPWVTVGTGVAVTGVGVGLLIWASGQRTDAKDLMQVEASAEFDAAKDKTIGGAVAVGIGSAAIAGGLIWWLVDRPQATATSLWIAPGTDTSVLVGGTF